MTILKTVTALGLVAGLSACGATQGVSRNQPLDVPGMAGGTVDVASALRDINVNSFRMVVPESLSVSESNGYYPIADIVWRGDPLGNRQQQISDIFTTAFEGGAAQLSGARPVDVQVVLARFHSVTDRTRWTVGGTHSIRFYLTVRDAATGAIMIDRQYIEADLPAFGGGDAFRAEQRGETQKVRVTAHLTNVLRDVIRGLPVNA